MSESSRKVLPFFVSSLTQTQPPSQVAAQSRCVRTAMFYQLIYVSRAVAPLSSEGIHSLVVHARAFNSTHHITGILFYDGEHFAQVLEGAQSEVDCLFARIQQDTRHRNVTVVTRSTRHRREYPHWGMAGHLLAAAQFSELVKCLPEEVKQPVPRSLRVRLEPFVTHSQRL